MSESRPSSVDELLDNVGDLLGVMHSIVDMNRKVMIRMYRLAEQFGIDSSEKLDFATEQAEKIHRMLYQWQEENIGTSDPSDQKPSSEDDI